MSLPIRLIAGLALFAGVGLGGEKAPATGVKGMEIGVYESSQDPSLKLTAEFHVPDAPKPLCLNFHGFYSDAKYNREYCQRHLAPKFFVVNVDMRGRGGSKNSGKPDCSGFELLDGLDALQHARTTWPTKIQAGTGPYLIGGSAGGGNVLALIGKAPDYFAAAAEWAGMSDYALWYYDKPTGNYSETMEKTGWIGQSPKNNPEGYMARGGLHLIPNILTPLLIVHGTKDVAVPIHHSERYLERAKELGKANVTSYFWERGHDSEDFPRFLEFFAKHTAPPPKLPQKGTLLVHSFLACQRFWLILDDPSRIGAAAYETSASGGLVSLTFSQAATNTPAREVILRLKGDVKKVSVSGAGGRREVKRWRQSGLYTDFKLTQKPPWTVTLAATTKDSEAADAAANPE